MAALSRLLRGGRNALLVSAGRVLSAGISYAIFVFFFALADPEGLRKAIFVQAALVVAPPIFGLGHHIVAVREAALARLNSSDRNLAAYVIFSMVCITSASYIAWLFVRYILPNLPMPGLLDLAEWRLLWLQCWLVALSGLVGGISRGLNQVVAGYFPRFVLAPLGALVGLFLAVSIAGVEISVHLLLSCLVYSQGAVLAGQLLLLATTLNGLMQTVPLSVRPIGHWATEGGKLWFASVSQNVVEQFDLLILGFLSANPVSAAYAAAVRTTNFLAIPQFVSDYLVGNRVEATPIVNEERIIARSSMIAFISCLMLLALMMVGAPVITGEQLKVDGNALLLFMAVVGGGHLANAAIGPATLIAINRGYTKAVSVHAFWSVCIFPVVFWFTATGFGLQVAVFVKAFAIFALQLTNSFYLRSELGMRTSIISGIYRG